MAGISPIQLSILPGIIAWLDLLYPAYSIALLLFLGFTLCSSTLRKIRPAYLSRLNKLILLVSASLVVLVGLDYFTGSKTSNSQEGILERYHYFSLWVVMMIHCCIPFIYCSRAVRRSTWMNIFVIFFLYITHNGYAGLSYRANLQYGDIHWPIFSLLQSYPRSITLVSIFFMFPFIMAYWIKQHKVRQRAHMNNVEAVS